MEKVETLIDKLALKKERAPVIEELRQFRELNWTELRFLPTPGWKPPDCFGPTWLPLVFDFRFSPRGRLGVSIAEEKGTNFLLVLLDVHNKLWFAYKLTELDIKYKDIQTYHMLNENILIVVEILDNDLVKQHIISVDLETRKAKFIQTVVHQFRHRSLVFEQALWTTDGEPHQHVPLTVNGNDYTALISSTIWINHERYLYLVPRNPWNTDIQPMEFMISTELTYKEQETLIELTGPSYNGYTFRFPAFASSGLLHLSPGIQLLTGRVGNRYVLLGVYLTIDVSKLIDIYDEPNEAIDELILYEDQEESMELILYPFEKTLTEGSVSLSCGDYGVVQYLKPWDDMPFVGSYFSTGHVLGSNNTFEMLEDEPFWFSMHPCGALLQFITGKHTRQMYVKVASVYNNTLESHANSKAIFHPNRPIGTIEGLHQMVFHGLKPIPLDKKAKKALGTYDEYMYLLRYQEGWLCHNWELLIPIFLFLVLILIFFFLPLFLVLIYFEL